MWSLLGSILSGGVTGLFGVLIQRFFDYKSKKLDIEVEKAKFEHDLALRKADAEIMAQEWASRTKVVEIEERGKVDVADANAFAVALTNEPKLYSEKAILSTSQSWLFVLLDLFRGLVRPLLTVYLCTITTMIYIQAYRMLNTSMSLEEAIGLLDKIIETILYLTTTCVLFWFGTRNKANAK